MTYQQNTFIKILAFSISIISFRFKFLKFHPDLCPVQSLDKKLSTNLLFIRYTLLLVL